MTNQEAIAYSKRVIDLGLNDETQAFCEIAIKALEQEPCDKYINEIEHLRKYISKLETQIVEQEPKAGWNNHQIACMLADLFGDACACNYNGIDEWLGELCDFKDNCCPNPVGVACWEQFLKYSQSRYTGCGYEVRDKGTLQEPSGDLISRQAALKKLKESAEHHANDSREEALLRRDRDIIRALTPVNPQEPKIGHWIAVVDKWGDIVTTVSGYKCSECGEFDSFRDKYCPNCGARMEGE